MIKPPEPAGMWLRCIPQSHPRHPAHPLRVRHRGKGVGKSQKLHSELMTKQKVAEMEAWSSGDTHQGHRKPETNSRAPFPPETFGEFLGVGLGSTAKGLGSSEGRVESSLFGHTSLAQAPAPLVQGLVICPALLPGQGSQPGPKARGPALCTLRTVLSPLGLF